MIELKIRENFSFIFSRLVLKNLKSEQAAENYSCSTSSAKQKTLKIYDFDFYTLFVDINNNVQLLRLLIIEILFRDKICTIKLY